jgi:cytochrome c-type biogenesis protein CcmI
MIPVIRQRNKIAEQTVDNIQLVKGRLKEIQQEFSQGLLSEADHHQAEQELKLALLAEQPDKKSANQSSRWLWLAVFSICLMIAAGVFYQSNQLAKLQLKHDAIDRLPTLSQDIVIQPNPQISNEDLRAFALGIRQRLRDDPQDAIGWLLLGRVHASLGDMNSALQSLKRAYRLSPENEGIMRSYAQLLVMTEDSLYLTQAIRVLKLLLAKSPQDTSILGMLAVANENTGNVEQALYYWQQLLSKTDPSAESYAAVVEKIHTLTEAQQPAMAEEGMTRLLIRVEVGENIQSALPEKGFLFVFAQAALGDMRMPAAVQKLPLASFPVEITLDNSHAMLPSYSLTQLNKTRLVARISQDEDVSAQQGELQGELLIDLIQDQQQSYLITIDKVLP